MLVLILDKGTYFYNLFNSLCVCNFHKRHVLNILILSIVLVCFICKFSNTWRISIMLFLLFLSLMKWWSRQGHVRLRVCRDVRVKSTPPRAGVSKADRADRRLVRIMTRLMSAAGI